ncbi:hypothetical protein CN568_20075 [Bacillus pseudomycoides]|uniref:class I adenylate-forming enzyme family protein n=1 Tax=Bacillus pseudomycoides TaxID=64104 RepID=UPI000BEF660F|nr:class I adenylate-forming enzyme family protein [Bacillus pseudomycoides]PEK32375.1 hypothetical protein CN691_16130 [Bacillus pseudomycoides]PEK67987.1 hypothetical protein CN593_13340 [Bacillus pseudomycoides]PEP38617.1 hypothetical protein CN565_24755 [Bacillus pseudomycoides]PEP42113.1 hypothetical protein CN568_20075 [Bacillus pseudomycoides]PFX40474.1 hypothetical protein COL31_28730 [Bacillus pseudomycoides]
MIVQNLLDNAVKHPEKKCIVDKSRSLTYGDMAKEIKQFASYLSAKNVKENDRILLCLPNSCDLLVAYCGTMLVGATVCFADYNMNMSSIQVIVKDLNPNLFFTLERTDLISSFEECESYPEAGVLSNQPEFIKETEYSNEIAHIMYTSGTTGSPKGVKITHDNIEFTAKAIIKWAHIESEDRELTTLPLSHSFGLGHFHCYAMIGGTMYIETGLLDVKRVFNALEKATSFPLTPAGVRFLLRYYKKEFQEKAKKLKYMIINTAPMPHDLTEELLDTLPNTDIYIYYGLTEASRSTYLHCNSNRSKLRSVGKPPQDVHIKIYNEKNAKEETTAGHVGEILISGHNVTSGYLNEDISQSICNGWLRTGDLGFIDEDGFLYITGRVKEQINIDGLKVSPYEIESLISTFPGINDVAIIGVSDKLLGESIAAFVVTEHQNYNEQFSNRIKQKCTEKTELYKVPKEIKFIREIPRDQKGKIQRGELLTLFNQLQNIQKK